MLGRNSACSSEGELKRRLRIGSDASLVRDEFFQHGVNKYSHSSQYLTPPLFCTRRFADGEWKKKTKQQQQRDKMEMHAVLRFHPARAVAAGLRLCRADLTGSLYLFSLPSSRASDTRHAAPGAPSRCQPPTPLGGTSSSPPFAGLPGNEVEGSVSPRAGWEARGPLVSQMRRNGRSQDMEGALGGTAAAAVRLMSQALQDELIIGHVYENIKI